LLTSSQIGDDYLVSDRKIEEVWRKTISTIWHSFLFFQTYKEKDFQPKNNFNSRFLLDQWILSKLHSLIKEINLAMKDYQLTNAARTIDKFVEDLSNWYIRRSRRRFQKPENKKEKEEASQTLYYVLVSLAKISAPFIPFLSEEIYLSLKNKKDSLSVHLCDYPKVNQRLINKKLEAKMEKVRDIVALALAERIKARIKVRQPLRCLQVPRIFSKTEGELLDLIKEEVNVKKISFGEKLELDKEITNELREEGIVREIIRQIQEMRKKIFLTPKDKISFQYQGEKELQEIILRNSKIILKEILAKNLSPRKNLKEKFNTEKEIIVEGSHLWLGIKKV